MEALEYVESDRTSRITFPNSERRLDGLFLSVFERTDLAAREQSLNELYQDKPLMVQAAMAFVVIFLSFLDDPSYFAQDAAEPASRSMS